LQPDPEELAVQSHARLVELLPDASPEAFEVAVWLSQSAADLAAVVHAETIAPLANDTSFAAVSMPRSTLESAVHAIETRLNSEEG